MNIYKSWSNILLILSTLLMFLGLFLLKTEWAMILQFNFIQIKSCKMEMFMIMDWISTLFSSAILFISSMVVKFSEEYMESETFKYRFLSLILLFILSMLLLVMSPNMMSILLGWDGLGLVSYCLIIYYQNPRSYNAGMLTILSNRIGDVLILISIALLMTSGSWNIIFLNLSNPYNFILILIMLAAMTKSAQIPFSAWLPAAMAAPTPVSALVHSSTLVTAGVFLLIRFHNMFLNSLTSSILLIISCLTMFMAGISATMETDMKKVIALSTLSQLGIMMMTLSLNMWILSYFHMITHAMFKSLLFLCAGFIIHNTKNNQDIRKMGSIIISSPSISTSMLTSSLALMGFPFMAGFYSKDLILEQTLNSKFLMFSMILILISFGMTMAYSIRMPYLSLISLPNFPSTLSIKETNMMKSSITSLSFMAISSGAFLSWIILPSPLFSMIHIIQKILGILLIFLGILLSMSIWILNTSINMKNKNKSFLGSMWFMTTISTSPISSIMTKIYFMKNSESGWNEMWGAQGTYKLILEKSPMISILQKNHTQIITISILISILILFIYP